MERYGRFREADSKQAIERKQSCELAAPCLPRDPLSNCGFKPVDTEHQIATEQTLALLMAARL